MTVNRTVDEYAKAIREAKGMISHAAVALGVTQQAVSARIARHPSLRQVLAESREAMKDVAEMRLFDRIDAGDAWAVCFYLKTQARDRGYVEKSEHEHSGPAGGPFRIVIETVDDRAP